MDRRDVDIYDTFTDYALALRDVESALAPTAAEYDVTVEYVSAVVEAYEGN